MTNTDKLTTTQVSESEGLDDWRVLLRTLQTSFKTGSMAKEWSSPRSSAQRPTR
jgi:hypothetical protein